MCALKRGMLCLIIDGLRVLCLVLGYLRARIEWMLGLVGF